MRIGILGGGTMGAGIAQLGALAGLETVVVDPVEGALERAREGIADGLQAWAARKGSSEREVAERLDRLRFSDALDALSDCAFVVEAVPEDLELKRSVLRAVAAVCADGAVIATNTSSLSVTRLAKGLPSPQRVIGTHFFNPAAVMKLVEVVPGLDTSDETVAAAVSLCERLGKRPLLVRDTPGFLVNRCARPFYGEALRLLAEGIAQPAQIDRICRLGGGFRMGPFELMDLIGNDVSLAATRTLYEASFGESRWRPSALQERLVAAGRLGRKTGVGWYAYADGARPESDPPPARPAAGATGAPRSVSVLGDSRLAQLVRGLLGDELRTGVSGSEDAVIVCDSPPPERHEHAAGVELLACAERTLASWKRPGAIGFNVVPAGGAVALVELTRGSSLSAAAESAADLFAARGMHVEWVGDAPGLVLGRIVVQLVNEACFAVSEGVSEVGDVDEAVRLGLNFPRGPFEWAEEIGWARVLAMLDGLWNERREERYRPAPFLQRSAWQV